MVVKVNDPALRALYRDGKWAGVSMGGDGDFIDENNPAGGKPGVRKGDPMTPEEMAALAALVTAEVKKALLVEKPASTAKVPVFKGDVTKASAKSLREHAAAVKKAQRFEGVDMNDPAALEALADELDAEDKAVKKAKISVLPPVTEDDGEEGAVTKADGETFEVEADEDVPEADLQRQAVVKAMLANIPANRRVAK